ncbi:MAG: DUF4129 domain-containing protein [Gammaproteobacteria bacterium]|nr:DUF4129 domain-containing protein [Gammaproteobacteria bacterium]
MRGALPALLLILGWPAHAATFDPIDACMARLDQGIDVGFARIRERCPELPAALRQGALAANLPAGWDEAHNQLSAQGLSELETLLARAQQPAVLRPPPDATRVAGVLRRIAQTEAQRSTWWSRFKYWLRRLLVAEPRQDGSWLERLFLGQSLSRHAADLILWSAMALVIALALSIVLNELRVAGLLRRRAAGSQHGAPAAERRGVTLQQLEQTPLRAQPGLLLELIVQRLAGASRLGAGARALTARELVRSAALPPAADRAHLAQLAQLGEELRYGEREVEPQRLEAALRAGRELLRLLQPAALRF